MKRIVICAVPYSDNFGDGVIAHTLTRLIQLKYPLATIELLDIAGRRDFQASALRGGSIFGVFQRLPAPVRAAAVFVTCCARYIGGWRKQWHAKLKDADLIIVGGGQLFSDVSLNFPTKLYLLGRQIRGRRTAILGVGVSGHWSLLGCQLIKRFLKDARPTIYGVRDVHSIENLKRIFGIAESRIALLADPALATASAYAPHLGEKKCWDIGLCISDVHSLHFNQDQGERVSSPMSFFLELYERLTSAGKTVLLFTNGASEDGRFAKSLLEHARRVNGEAASRMKLLLPKRPTEVVATISSCSAIVAHRMHANIIAFSLAIPSVGIEWDPKLRGFFTMAEREDFLLPMDCSASSVVEALSRVQPIDPDVLVALNTKLVNATLQIL